MSHNSVMCLLLATAAFFIWQAYRVSGRVTRGRENAKEWRHSLMSAATLMIVILLANSTVFAKDAMSEVWRLNQSPTFLDLIGPQLSVVAGTAALMWLVVRSLRHPAVFEEPTPELGMSRTAIAIVENLLPRFWLAGLGLGVAFGFAGGRGLVLFLAVELTLSWAIGRLTLAYTRRKQNKQRE